MADYGLLLKNDSQEIQIDSTYKNLSLDNSGSGTTISNDNTGTGHYTRISINSSPLLPLMLIRPNTDDFVSVKNYYKSGDDFAGVDLVTKYSETTTIDWKSYRENRTASGVSYGLLVYNPEGGLCFDSGKDYFKIFSVHTGISLDSPPGGFVLDGDYTDITHSGISDPFYVLSPSSNWVSIAYNEVQDVTFSMRWMVGLKKLSSTSVRVGWFRYTRSSGVSGYYPFYEGNNPTFKLVVCDA